MTEPSEADRQAAREWLLPEIDFDAAVYEGAVQSLASVIAKHHAAERKRARHMTEAHKEMHKRTDLVGEPICEFCEAMAKVAERRAEARAALESSKGEIT